MKSIFRYVIAAWAFLSSSAYSADLRFLEYDGIQLVADCELRSAIRFFYSIGPNHSHLNRRSSFYLDPDLSPEYHQLAGG